LWFSIVDIVKVLTQTFDFKTARKYLNKVKERLKADESELLRKFDQLILVAEDGKL